MTDICYPSCEQPQTRRGQERRLALLIYVQPIYFWKKVMMLFLWMILSIMQVDQNVYL